MQTRSSDENSVCLSVRLSVCLSVKRVLCDKMEERSVQIFISNERPFSLVFWEEEWLVEGDPFYLKFWVNCPHWSKIADFQPIITRSASAVISSEKSSINADRKSTTHFPMSLSDRHTLPLSPQRASEKCETADLRKKSDFAWRKSATKFLSVKTVSGKVVRHSLA